MSERDDKAGGAGVNFTLAKPVRQPWRPFDDNARTAFLQIIRTVRSRRRAAKLIGVSHNTVQFWVECGKREQYRDEDYEYRLFYLQLLEAEAHRDTLAERALAVEAVADWRAADAMLKRSERLAIAPFTRREAKAKAETAEASARIARAKVEVVERAAAKIAGMVFFPAEFLEKCTAEERAVIETAMRRESLIFMPDSMMAEVALEQDTSDIDELEAALERHPRRTLRGEVIDVGPEDEGGGA